MYMPVAAFERTSSVILGQDLTHWAKVTDTNKEIKFSEPSLYLSIKINTVTCYHGLISLLTADRDNKLAWHFVGVFVRYLWGSVV